MHSEADICKKLLDRSTEAGSKTILETWPAVGILPVKGTRYSTAKFSDGSMLYITSQSAEAVEEMELAEEFFQTFGAAVMKWLLSVPTDTWPKSIREAYAKAGASDPFAASVWEDVARRSRAGAEASPKGWGAK